MWEKVRGMREAECSCLALWVPARSAPHGLLLAAAGLSADPCPLASHLISESLEPRPPGDHCVLPGSQSESTCSLDGAPVSARGTEATVQRGRQGTDLKLWHRRGKRG